MLDALDALAGSRSGAPSALRDALRLVVPQLRRSGADDATARRVLADRLIANNAPITDAAVLAQLEALLFAGTGETVDAEERAQMRANVNGTLVLLCRADITRLAGVDAIVNAANSRGLGCFVPKHRCVDNVIHRASGPRLREACREEMLKRGRNWELGSDPILTPGFRLPAAHVLHVVGPQIDPGERVSAQDEAQLEQCYVNSLQACVDKQVSSVAFCCISTGLFGYPQLDACIVALRAVRAFLQRPQPLTRVVFVVHKRGDEQIYRTEFQRVFAPLEWVLPHSLPSRVSRAREWLAQADSVLICAGAGLSAKSDESMENVYVDARHFAAHYPFMLRFGYRTAYEAMGLFQDDRVPNTVKWAFWAKHFSNMRFAFTPNQAYGLLRERLANQNKSSWFVVTSNVDGCFERAGFDPAQVYRPQGDMARYQCLQPCRPDATFDVRPVLDELLPYVTGGGEGGLSVAIPVEKVPTCKYCGGPTFGNLRGGDWFLHTPQDETNDALVRWVKERKQSQSRLVVLEIGAGHNTPTVTRYPMEMIVRDLENARLIRVNPTEARVPQDLSRAGRAVSIEAGWQILEGMLLSSSAEDEDAQVACKDDDDVDEDAVFFNNATWEQLFAHLKRS